MQTLRPPSEEGKIRIRRYLHRLGSLTALAGVVFVGLRLRDYGSRLDFHHFTLAEWLLVALLALPGALCGVVLAVAWRRLLRFFGVQAPLGWALATYGMTQIAKYVPGNIFHLAGRQAAGMAVAMDGGSLAKATVMELVLLTVSGTLFAMLCLPLVFPFISPLMGAALIVAAITMTLGALWGKRWSGIAAALGWYLVFCLVFGSIFALLVALADGWPAIESFRWLPLAGVYVLAWLIGMLTPGAPAGLGVREAVLLFLLENKMGESSLLFIVLVGRLVMVAGDVLFFLGSCLAKVRQRRLMHG